MSSMPSQSSAPVTPEQRAMALQEAQRYTTSQIGTLPPDQLAAFLRPEILAVLTPEQKAAIREESKVELSQTQKAALATTQRGGRRTKRARKMKVRKGYRKSYNR
jgi:Spy/CpxP family protein refolding chaperone